MRNKTRIELLEIHVAYLNEYIEMISASLMELLEKEDERQMQAKDIESGKWYKNH